MNHDYICPVEATLEIVGGKYKPLILWHLSGKTLRFGQLQKLLSSATPKMLTKQLRELENDGLIARKSLSRSSAESGIFTYTARNKFYSYIIKYLRLGK